MPLAVRMIKKRIDGCAPQQRMHFIVLKRGNMMTPGLIFFFSQGYRFHINNRSCLVVLNSTWYIICTISVIYVWLTGQGKCFSSFVKCVNSYNICSTGVPTPPPVCEDKIPNCKAYNPSTCTDPQFKLWVADNCKKFCGLCKY